MSSPFQHRVSGRTRRGRAFGALSAIVATALLMSGCGSSSTSKSDGQSLTMATWAATTTLDPAVSGGTGIAGGSELAALYDTIMRYDADSGKYEPQTAESLEPNDDFTKWTLKLRDGITFSDGTPYDSAAVVASMKRLVEKHARTASLVAPITKFATPDPLTVVFTLASPWNGFPFALASAPGMIVSPKAAETLGDDLGTNPVGAGAGPFVIDSFKAGESVTMSRNPDYWAGEPQLEKLTFIHVGNDAQTYEAFKAGTVQAAMLRSPSAIADADADGAKSIKVPYSGTDTIVMNNGIDVTCQGGQPEPKCTGKDDGTVIESTSPTADKRIRQAVAAAIDFDTVNMRSYEGKGTMDTSLISPASRWYDGVDGPQYDLAKAKALVAEVKAEGDWDGTIRVSCHAGKPTWGPTIQGLLEAAGFKVKVNDQQDVAANVAAVTVRRDFDLACFGSSIADAEPFNALNRDFNSAYVAKGGGNFSGYVNPEVDKAIAEGRAAKTEEAEKAAITKIAEAYTRDVPFLIETSQSEGVLLDDGLEGVMVNTNTVVMFNDAHLS